MATTLKNVAEAHQVALDVSRRILEGITNPSLCRQIHNNTRLFLGEQGHKCLAILQSH